MKKSYLYTPGPTTVPPEVMAEMSKPIIHHRDNLFGELFGIVREGLKKIYGTQNDVIILSGSGTLAMEAAVVNTLSADDKVLVVNAGKFGERWIEIANEYKLKVLTINVEWGNSVSLEEILKVLDSHKDVKAVFIQASETSTTTCHPIEAIGRALKSYDDLLFIVDGITYVGVSKIEMDEWGIDVLVTGSQKALMLPPGLAFIALSDRAIKKLDRSNLPKYYLNLKLEMKAQKNNKTSYTPAVSLIVGLKKSLELMFDEGLENVFERHNLMAFATRKALEALNLKLLTKGIPSNAATGIVLDDGVNAKDVIKFAKKHYGVYFAGGQAHLEKKVIRVSHLGYHSYMDSILGIAALEMALKQYLSNINFGAGTSVAQEIINSHIVNG
jgi:aspartate aminotransferase-like enzyme